MGITHLIPIYARHTPTVSGWAMPSLLRLRRLRSQEDGHHRARCLQSHQTAISGNGQTSKPRRHHRIVPATCPRRLATGVLLSRHLKVLGGLESPAYHRSKSDPEASFRERERFVRPAPLLQRLRQIPVTVVGGSGGTPAPLSPSSARRAARSGLKAAGRPTLVQTG